MNEELVKAFEEGRRAERERIVAFLRDPAHCERGGDLVGEMFDRLAGIIEKLEVGGGDAVTVPCSACAGQGDVPCPGPYGKGCGDGTGCGICDGWTRVSCEACEGGEKCVEVSDEE